MNELIELLKGETAVLYGQPMVGKTISIAILAKLLKKETGKPAFFIWSDSNLLGEYGNFIKELSGAETKYVSDDRGLNIVLRALRNKGEEGEFPYSMVAVDSITGFQEAIMEREGVDSPRVGLLLGRVSQIVAKRFREMAAQYNIPTVMIAHQTAIFKPDSPFLGPFAGKSHKPTIVTKALRNTTLLLYQYVDPQTRKPVWEVEDIRSGKEKVEKFPKGTKLTLEIEIK